MTNQTNEEINVKGKHLPRVWMYSGDLGDNPLERIPVLRRPHGGYAHLQCEYLSLVEHNEIVSAYKDLLKMKDAEIVEVKELLRKDHERECVASLLHESETKLARAVEALESAKLALSCAPMWTSSYSVGYVKSQVYDIEKALAEISATPVLADKQSYVFGQEVEET